MLIPSHVPGACSEEPRTSLTLDYLEGEQCGRLLALTGTTRNLKDCMFLCFEDRLFHATSTVLWGGPRPEWRVLTTSPTPKDYWIIIYVYSDKISVPPVASWSRLLSWPGQAGTAISRTWWHSSASTQDYAPAPHIILWCLPNGMEETTLSCSRPTCPCGSFP